MPLEQFLALRSLFNSTNGLHWAYQSPSFGEHWDFSPHISAMPANPCTAPWQFLTCDASCSVILLSFPANSQLKGPLPSTLSDLIALEVLQIGANGVTGTLPPLPLALKELTIRDNLLSGNITSIVGCTNLTVVDLSGNRLSGTFPAALLQGNLSTLILDANDLSGTLPGDFRNWRSIRKLFLAENHLTGRLPEIGAGLSAGSWAGNQFTSTIPSSFCQNVSTWHLSNNYLTGIIPSCVGAYGTLQRLWVDDNLLTGSLPPSLSLMVHADIRLTSNSFTGTIPVLKVWQMSLEHNHFTGSLPNLLFHSNAVLYISDNSFTGALPVVDWSLLIALDASYNDLTGPLDLTGMSGLQELFLASNDLTGTLPASLPGGMRFLDVSLNSLTGTLPHSLMPSQMWILNASRNALRGTLFQDGLPYGGFGLHTLDMSTNHFTGSLGSYGVNLTELVNLILRSNDFSGPFAALGNMSALEVADLSKNAFTGSIPSVIFNLQSLRIFAAQENCLSGSLPATICLGGVNLTTLALDGMPASRTCHAPMFPGIMFSSSYVVHGRIFGSIPGCLFSDYPNLQTLHLSSNNLHGSLPEMITVSEKLRDLSLSHNHLSGKQCCLYAAVSVCWEEESGVRGGWMGCAARSECAAHAQPIPHCSSPPSWAASPVVAGLLDATCCACTCCAGLTLCPPSGHIPLGIQQKAFSNLDLSFNRFFGIIHRSIYPYSDNGSLALNANHLSGDIPAALRLSKNIHILQGNIFQCAVTGKHRPVPHVCLCSCACHASDGRCLGDRRVLPATGCSRRGALDAGDPSYGLFCCLRLVIHPPPSHL